MSEHPNDVQSERRIFCNRTINLRSIRAIGFDMDYTLVHYNVDEWEGRAFDYTKKNLSGFGWDVSSLKFEPDRIIRGLAIDRKRGNIVKANRFGYVKAAMHGSSMMEFRNMREQYRRELVELSSGRFRFLNTLFSISEAWIYAQLVDLLDAGKLPGVMNYADLHDSVRRALDLAHIEGKLKADITNDPERFIEVDDQLLPALMDMKHAGKKLALITNSGWPYSKLIMDYAFGEKWGEIFDLTVVSARKPDFFLSRPPMFRIINAKGHMEPLVGKPKSGNSYLGGYASLVEKALGVRGDQFLYVGDHIYGDVNVSKNLSQWRTCLIVREMEDEVSAINDSLDRQNTIAEKMEEKKKLEHAFSALRLEKQRNSKGYGPTTDSKPEDLDEEMEAIHQQLVALDVTIGPLASVDGKQFNPHWGYLLRAGNDKSHLTRQIERHADLYTSRVSNFLNYTPYMYFRAPRGNLPHDFDGRYY